MNHSEADFQKDCAQDLLAVWPIAKSFSRPREAHFLRVVYSLAARISASAQAVTTLELRGAGKVTGSKNEFDGAVACFERLIQTALAAGRLERAPNWKLVRKYGGGRGYPAVHFFVRLEAPISKVDSSFERRTAVAALMLEALIDKGVHQSDESADQHFREVRLRSERAFATFILEELIAEDIASSPTGRRSAKSRRVRSRSLSG